ncbi:MAG TPA: hypothetical protein VFG72_11395 [Marmoricola sp.]|nr:hypothetical protein [Marmoricola sp.]
MDEDRERSTWEAEFRTPGAERPAQAATLPDSVRLSLWFSAWCDGLVSLDAARDAVVQSDAAHDVVGLPGRDESVPLILALGALRAERAAGAGLALPVPGDPVGLAGPPAFNAEALESGEAVVLRGVDLGLVPVRAGAGVVWRCLPAHERRQVPDLTEADTGLRAALPQVADELAALDVARWRPEVADELMALRRPGELEVPDGTSPRAQRMVALAVRCRRIVSLALADDGGAVTAADADRRREALLPLDRAARRALVAACSHPFGR